MRPSVKTIIHNGKQQELQHSIDKIYNSFGGQIQISYLFINYLTLDKSLPKVLLIYC